MERKENCVRVFLDYIHILFRCGAFVLAFERLIKKYEKSKNLVDLEAINEKKMV